jgi:ParB-like chromosome segregation protein Spo0J
MIATETKVAETKIPRTYEPHPLADLFPLLDKDSHGFKALIEDIQANGQHQPAILLDGKILDGRNRYNACQHLGKDVLTRDYLGTDPIGFVLSVNLHRRHLNVSQRAMVAAKLTNLELGANQHTQGTSIEVAAKFLNVGRASVERARQVLAKGDPSEIEAVEQGNTSITAAAAATATATGAGTSTPGGSEDPGQDKGNPAKAYNITSKLITELNELKTCDAATAIAAASNAVRRLQEAGFVKKSA